MTITTRNEVLVTCQDAPLIAYGDWEIRVGFRVIAEFKNRLDALNAAHHLTAWKLAA
ncbi:hypothetical protein VVR46_00320 [Corynebacterium phoceense]|uniref:hypothetical protein n=1 Tax=Corynebacterium phoceense TaxID=1686286 RepID=UPI0034CF1ABA